MSHRIRFFLGAAFLCALLIPIADAKHRIVPVVLCGVYLVLTLLTWLCAIGVVLLPGQEPALTHVKAVG